MNKSTVKATAANVTLSPIVAAMLTSNKSKAPLSERLLQRASNAVADTTLVVGRLIESVDTDRYNDGVKTQRFLNIKSRSDYWRAFADQHGLSEEDVAAIIAN
jgi:hypothetical protein